MSSTVDLMWAKTPTFSKDKAETANDALVAFSSYVPPLIFQSSKSFWQGYAQHNGRKQALYKVELIEHLLQQTFLINIEGTQLSSSVRHFPGSRIINKIINASIDCQNETIAKMSHKQRQLIIYKTIKRELWSLFNPSEIVSENKYDLSSGEWTSVKPSKNEREFNFNLSLGLLHYLDNQQDEEGTTHEVHKVSTLKDNDQLISLIKLVTEFKKYGKTTEIFQEYDFSCQWSEGFSELVKE